MAEIQWRRWLTSTHHKFRSRQIDAMRRTLFERGYFEVYSHSNNCGPSAWIVSTRQSMTSSTMQYKFSRQVEMMFLRTVLPFLTYTATKLRTWKLRLSKIFAFCAVVEITHWCFQGCSEGYSSSSGSEAQSIIVVGLPKLFRWHISRPLTDACNRG